MQSIILLLLVLVTLTLLSVIILGVMLFRWMKRRDAAQANLLRRMMELRHETASLRAMQQHCNRTTENSTRL